MFYIEIDRSSDKTFNVNIDQKVFIYLFRRPFPFMIWDNEADTMNQFNQIGF